MLKTSTLFKVNLSELICQQISQQKLKWFHFSDLMEPQGKNRNVKLARLLRKPRQSHPHPDKI